MMTDQSDNQFMLDILKTLNRERIHDVWEAAKAGSVAHLDKEDQKLAQIMMQHQEEFHNQFEFADVMSGHDFDPEHETNPFLHILLHLMVEKHLELRDPIEAYQFYLSMRRKKSNHHEVVHLVSTVFVYFLFEALKYKKPFDNDGYRNTLKRLKDKKPEKIMAAMEKEKG
ncbi:MAG TPA: DUF1841 family protein [Smithellaceae bacterium]|nr:DUF1841 family protein [Smithellaceae bacterium]